MKVYGSDVVLGDYEGIGIFGIVDYLDSSLYWYRCVLEFCEIFREWEGILWIVMVVVGYMVV